MRSLALVIAAQTGPVEWVLYQSTVSAPRAKFVVQAPHLVDIWTSYRVDPRVGAERLRKASESMDSCWRIVGEVNRNRQAAADRGMDRFIDYINDRDYVLDDETGTVYEASDDVDLNQILNSMNREEGYQRYRQFDPHRQQNDR
jgi:hypothetical protein